MLFRERAFPLVLNPQVPKEHIDIECLKTQSPEDLHCNNRGLLFSPLCVHHNITCNFILMGLCLALAGRWVVSEG